MKFLFVTAAMIVALFHLHSQTLVKGEIKDSKSNLPIEGATIFVTHTSVATSSDAQGNFTLRGYYPSTDNGRSNSENFAGLGYQLYLNNIPVTDATGTTVMDDIDFLNIGKVEVIKGPSPLYGSYIAGAVNLYTPRSMPN